MFRFVADNYGVDAIDDAWDEFNCWSEEQSEPWNESSQEALFLPWMLHQWAPDPEDTEVANTALHDVSPTRAFLDRHGTHLDPIIQRYLESCLASPLAFQEIVAVEPGRGFRARELVFGHETEVLEQSASKTLHKGDILFAALVSIDGIVLMEACPAFPFPPQCKLQLLRLRELIMAGKETAETAMREWDFELREAFHALADSIKNPVRPQMQNTDGEPLSLQRLIFDIDSAQVAFDALKHLALGDKEAELLANAQRAADGTLKQIEIPWLKAGNKLHKGWSNTLLGNIEIVGQRLSINVNSDQRAAKFRQVIDEALGKRARYRVTELQSLENALSQSRHSGSRMAPSAEQERLNSNPQVQAMLREHMRLHYEGWVNEKLPALDGKTPLQAARSADGRERLEALIAQIERDGMRMTPPLDESITQQLRSRLGLAPD
jgi:hypothetical protein